MTAVFDTISSQSEAKKSEMHPRDDCQTVKNHAFMPWCRTSRHSSQVSMTVVIQVFQQCSFFLLPPVAGSNFSLRTPQ